MTQETGKRARRTRNGPGRPTGGDSDKTRQHLLDVARHHFAQVGYASAALTTIAADAGLTTAALYYYFKGKADLYEAVYHATAPVVWATMETAAACCDGMVDGVDALIRSIGRAPTPLVHHQFLSAVPTVAHLHPEFRHLLEDRHGFQVRVFRSLAERGAARGELGSLSVEAGAEFLRLAVMGYFFERYHRRERVDSSVGPLLAGLRALAGPDASP